MLYLPYFTTFKKYDLPISIFNGFAIFVLVWISLHRGKIWILKTQTY
jgi:hypothetical protein